MNNTELSIQINLGGFSFSLRSSLSRAEIYGSTVENYDFSIIERTVYAQPIDRVLIFDNTARASVIPYEHYQAQNVESYLKALNLVALGDLPLSVLSSNKVVVWAADKQIYDAVQTVWPHALWSHPMAEMIRTDKSQSIDILLLADVAHITVFDQNELFAVRSIAFEAAEDLLYFVRQMATCDTYNVYQVSLYGDVQPCVSDLFSRYYAEVQVCLDPLFLVRL